jgi:hypothetical protein
MFGRRFVKGSVPVLEFVSCVLFSHLLLVVATKCRFGHRSVQDTVPTQAICSLVVVFVILFVLTRRTFVAGVSSKIRFREIVYINKYGNAHILEMFGHLGQITIVSVIRIG